MKTPQTTISFWMAIPKLKTSGLLAEAEAPGYQHRPVMGEMVANALLGLKAPTAVLPIWFPIKSSNRRQNQSAR
jgi:hypothetical protein